MVELGLTVYEWEADSILSQDFIVVAPTGVLPRLLIESVGQVPESRVVNDSAISTIGKSTRREM